MSLAEDVKLNIDRLNENERKYFINALRANKNERIQKIADKNKSILSETQIAKVDNVLILVESACKNEKIIKHDLEALTYATSLK